MPTGKLRTYVVDRGFGFLNVPGSSPVFFHYRDAELDPAELRIGDMVSFEWGTGRDGRPIAIKIRWAE
jgi:cold shock CspA family protein